MGEGGNYDPLSKRKLLNVILLGLVFMLVAGRIAISVMKTVLASATEPGGLGQVDNFTGDGYVANSLLYATFALANFLAPWVISLVGPRRAMLIGGVGYTMYAAQMLYLADWLLYLCAVANGLGAALLWTGQGNFISINSDPTTVGRNAGIFWALYQMSGVIGNSAILLLFRGVQVIDSNTRMLTGAVLTGLCVFGMLLTLLLRPTPWHNEHKGKRQTSGPWQGFKSCLELLWTRNMAVLSLAFLYSGLETCFWAGVFPSSISFSQVLGPNRKSTMGLCNIMIPLGSLVGGLGLAAIKGTIIRRGRVPVVIFGCLLHTIAFLLSFLTLPHFASLQETEDLPYIQPRTEVLILTAILLGGGDACLNTQIISILGDTYKDQSSEAFALMKLIQSVGVSVGFAQSTHLGLYWQLLVLQVAAVLSTAGFYIVETKMRRNKLEAELERKSGNPEMTETPEIKKLTKSNDTDESVGNNDDIPVITDTKEN